MAQNIHETNETNDSIRRQILAASGEVIVKATQKSIRIVDIILREDGLPSIFVGKYSGMRDLNQYFFYRDELSIPALEARRLSPRSKFR